MGRWIHKEFRKLIRFPFGKNPLEVFIKMKIYYQNKKIDIPTKKVSFLGKFSGLMFKSKNTKNLLFNFKEKKRVGIHSFFVMFPFLAIWTDENNQVIEFKIIESFTPLVKPKKSFSKLIEIPLNNKNKKIVDYFVGRKRTDVVATTSERKI